MTRSHFRSRASAATSGASSIVNSAWEISCPGSPASKPTLSHGSEYRVGAIPSIASMNSDSFMRSPALVRDLVVEHLPDPPRDRARLVLSDRAALDPAHRHHLHDAVRQKDLVGLQQVV